MRAPGVCPSPFVSQHHKTLVQMQGLKTPKTHPRGTWKTLSWECPLSLLGSFDLSWPWLVLLSVPGVLVPKLPLGVMGMTHTIWERPELCIH